MTTNKGICTEVTKDGEPFASKDGTKSIQGWMVKMSDGGHGYAYGPANDPCPFEVGKEYAYYGVFTKKGQVKLTLAEHGGIDRDTLYTRIEALKVAEQVLSKNPEVSGKQTKDYIMALKLTAKSIEAHINRQD